MIKSYKTIRYLNRTWAIITSLAVMLYLVFPVFWLLMSSFKMPVELFASPPKIFPEAFSWSNYVKVLLDASFLNSLKNSFIVAIFTTSASLIIGTLAGYVFARYRFKGKKTLLILILGTQMMPFVIILIPLFVIMRRLQLIDTYLGLIFAYMTFSVPYAIWMLNAFFKTIPFELEEAAMVDGCTRLKAIWKVLLPLSRPGVTSTGIFVLIGAWNHYLYATVLSESVTRTFPIRMQNFMGQERVIYEQMYPAAILGSLPILIIVFIFQKNIISGLTSGGIKS